MGSAPSELSTVSVTSARPSGARPDVPAKMTSSILPPRSAFAPCSPITQDNASSTLDLPEPFGPTTQVMPGSKRSVVAEAKDVKRFSVRLFRRIRAWLLPAIRPIEGTGPTRSTVGGDALRHADPSRGGTPSPLPKPSQTAPRLTPALHHGGHPAGGARRAEQGQQTLTGVLRPFGDDLDPAVGQV